MYENMTYEALMNEKLGKVSELTDRREGSIIYDALAPNALESAMLYTALDTVLEEAFADTASREYLIRRAKERGISPMPATYAVGLGVFDIEIAADARFSLDKFNYAVTKALGADDDGNYRYQLTCETPGSEPNAYTGRLIPIEHIDGLGSAVLESIEIAGEDEESTETLRRRYFDSFSSQAFGGNRAQYIAMTESLPGVGRCKAYRASPSAGKVKLVITDSDFKPAKQTLVDAVQKAIDPTDSSGEGAGLAPIDHAVTVYAAVGKTVNITSKLTLASGVVLSEIQPSINALLDEYYRTLNSTFGDTLIVRISAIESKLLSLDSVVDISDTALNGSKQNLTLAADEVAIRGEFANE